MQSSEFVQSPSFLVQSPPLFARIAIIIVLLLLLRLWIKRVCFRTSLMWTPAERQHALVSLVGHNQEESMSVLVATLPGTVPWRETVLGAAQRGLVQWHWNRVQHRALLQGNHTATPQHGHQRSLTNVSLYRLNINLAHTSQTEPLLPGGPSHSLIHSFTQSSGNVFI